MKRFGLWECAMAAVLLYGVYVAWNCWSIEYAQGK